MSTNYAWVPRKRNYELEKRVSPSSEALLHPLRPPTSFYSTNQKDRLKKSTESSAGKENRSVKSQRSEKKEDKPPEFIDPLGVTIDDPLSANENESSRSFGLLGIGSKQKGGFEEKTVGPLDNTLVQNGHPHSAGGKEVLVGNLPWNEGVEAWESKRGQILQSFRTNEKLSIVTSFLSGGVPLHTQLAVADRTTHRLDQLDQVEKNSMRRMADLSQQEYITRINELGAALRDAWSKDERVQSVKIVIQSAKLLGDVSVAQFYPSQFVLVTDILETFGHLVFCRLWNKANQDLEASGKATLGENGQFNERFVPESTKETTRNWFYKVASIRELLPRFFVEAAILRCQKFLVDDGEFFRAELNRLALMVRGIGNPLVAAYARCYLCRVGMMIASNEKLHIWTCLNDWLRSWPSYLPVLTSLSKGDEYGIAKIFWPAMEWILSCLSFRASGDEFLPIIEYCKQEELQAVLLSPVLSSLPPSYVASEAVEMTRLLLKSSESLPAGSANLLRCFGQALLKSEPSPEIQRPLLSQMWKLIMRYDKIDNYMAAGEVWLEFACCHFGPREVNTLLQDMIVHLTPDKAYEDFYPRLLNILDRIVTNMKNFQTIFTMERFVAFLDLLRKDHVRVQACNVLLEAFGRYLTGWTEDASVSNHVMSLCKFLHDALNAMSLDDERRHTSQLIIRSLHKFRFSTDSEQELNFLVEARGNFSNLDEVIEYVTKRSSLLIIRTREKFEGRMSRKSAYFIRACVAYAYITIPSIVDQLTRLRLYVESASVALMNNCLPQGDALLKAAISLIPELPYTTTIQIHRKRSNEQAILDAILSLLGLLLIVPDPPEQNQPLYLFNGFLTAVRRFEWPESSDGKTEILIACLAWLSAAEQAELPYHMEALESNDALYGGSSDFKTVVRNSANSVLEEVLGHLKVLAGSGEYRRQATISLNLLDSILSHGDLENEGMNILAGNLWNLARKYGESDKQRILRIGTFVRDRAKHISGGENGWTNLSSRMKL